MNDKGKFMRKNTLYVPEETESSFSVKRPQVTVRNIIGKIPEANIQEAVADLIQITGITSASLSNLPNNTSVRLTSTLTDKAVRTRLMLGICEVTAYQTSITPSNIIPYGSNTIAASYKLHTGYDLADNTNTGGSNTTILSPSKAISYTHHIHNESGSGKAIIWLVRWRYIGRPTSSVGQA